MTALNLLIYSSADNILFVCLFLFQQFDNLTVDNVSLWQQDSKQSYAVHWVCVQHFILRLGEKRLLINLICELEHLRYSAKGTYQL